MEKKKIILPKLRYEKAPEIDNQLRIGFQEQKSLLRTDDRDFVLDLAEQFAAERAASNRYFLYGKMKMVFRNLYAGASPYQYLRERLALVGDGSDSNFCGYLPYNEFAFLRDDLYYETTAPVSVDTLSGFTQFDLIMSGSTQHQTITNLTAPYHNWNIYLTHIYDHEINYPITYTLTGNTTISFLSGDGIPFRVQTGTTEYTLTSPVKHGINQGEYILIDGRYYYVNSVGNSTYRSEDFVLSILNSQLSGVTFGALVTGKRCTDIADKDICTSMYYVHKHRTLTKATDGYIDKVGFESPIWEDEKKLLYENINGDNDVLVVRNRMESILFYFKDPFILSGITNNLGYTPTELYVSIIFRNGNGYFNYPPKVGFTLHLHDSWVDEHFDGITALETGITSTSFFRDAIEFHSGNELPIGSELYGAFVEYNPKEMKERIISETLHKIVADPLIFNHAQTSSDTYSGATPTNPIGLLYQPHYRFKLRELSPYVESSNIDTPVENLPENAIYFPNERVWRWRDLYEDGYIDPDGYGTDYPYMNDMHYIHNDINFYIRNEQIYTNKKDGIINLYKNDNIADECADGFPVYLKGIPVTPSPSVSRTATPSVSVSRTPSISVTATPSITPSMSPSMSTSISVTATPSITPSITATSGLPPSMSPSISLTPSVTATPSISVSPLPVLGYFISPTGSDSGTGTISDPWFTLNRAWTEVGAGDTIYMRGGIYEYDSAQLLSAKSGTSENYINIWAYPGETPIFTKSASFTYPGWPSTLVRTSGRYQHWKGLEISGATQTPSNNLGGFTGYLAHNSIFELFNVHHCGGGFQTLSSGDNLILNSDFHHNWDPYDIAHPFPDPLYDPYGDADGCGIQDDGYGTETIVRGCRFWNNSDDGIDLWYSRQKVTLENCWSWNNGYREDGVTEGGDGNGFKLGPLVPSPYTGYSTEHRRTIQNCVAFDNRTAGFTENAALCVMKLYNNISFRNGTYGFVMMDYGEGTNEAMNNITYANVSGNGTFRSTDTLDHNTFLYNGTNNTAYSVSDADFVSVIATGVDGPRQADGSLPILQFLQLADGSDLIWSGVSISGLTLDGYGNPYHDPPSLGPFEWTPAPSSTPSITPSITVTPSVSLSRTPSITPSATPSITPSISISISPSITPSVSSSSYITSYRYVSNTGSDSNDGLTVSTPWQTVDKVNTEFSSLPNGTGIFFNRGDTFDGTLIVSKSGASGAPMMFGDYGSGNKPVINGFTTITGGWTDEGGGIYSHPITADTQTNMVLVNGTQVAMGRWPNGTTYRTFESHSSYSAITDTTLSEESPYDWTGAEVVIRMTYWLLGRFGITNHSGDVITYSGSTIDYLYDGFGYFIQNDLRTLDVENEWYHDINEGKFYIYGNPAGKTIQIATKFNILQNHSAYDYITIGNLDLRGSIDDIISFNNGSWGNVANSKIENCDLKYGGSRGIDIVGSNDNIINNTIDYCNDNAINLASNTNTVITGNTITNIGMLLGQSKGLNANGIYNGAYGSIIEHNIINNIGLNGITAGSATSGTLQYNYITNYCMTLNDGGGIYHGPSNRTYTSDYIMNYNICLSGYGNYNGTTSVEPFLAEGIYLDSYCTGHTVQHNICADNAGTGIKLSSSHDNTLEYNLCYNNKEAQLFSAGFWSEATLYDNIIRYNQFIGKESTHIALKYSVTNFDSITNYGTSDYNYYARPINQGTNDDIFLTYKPSEGTDYKTLSEWKTYSSQDANSNVSLAGSVSSVDDIHFIYNETTENKYYALSTTMYDVANTSYSGIITLASYTGLVLFGVGTVTYTPTPTLSTSATPTVTPSITPSTSLSITPSTTPSTSLSVTPSPTPSVSLSITPSRTPSVSLSITPSITPSASLSMTPSATPGLTYLTYSGETYYYTETGSSMGLSIAKSVPTVFEFLDNSLRAVNLYGYLIEAGVEIPSVNDNHLDGEVIRGNKFTWDGNFSGITDQYGTCTAMTITHGVFTGHMVDVKIYHNYLWRVPMGIIRKSGNNMTNASGGVFYNIVRTFNVGGVVKGMSNVAWYNNTFYQDRTTYDGNNIGAGTWRGAIDVYTNTDIVPNSVAHGTKIKNNIFYSVYKTYAISVQDTESLTDFECDYNIYWVEEGDHTPVFNHGGTYYTWSQWTGAGYDLHSVVVNPNFNNTTDLVPASKSTIQIGTNLGTEFNTGLSTSATWTVGVSPATQVQSGTWQVGARIFAP